MRTHENPSALAEQSPPANTPSQERILTAGLKSWVYALTQGIAAVFGLLTLIGAAVSGVMGLAQLLTWWLELLHHLGM